MSTSTTGPLTPRSGLVADIRRRLLVYRTFTGMADNKDVSLWTASVPHLSELPDRIPFLRAAYRRRRLAAFEQDLRLFNDVLADSPMTARYWVWAGLLLGWAREGRVLPHDIGDADFGYDAADDDLLDRTEPLLLGAGFRRWFCFRNEAGELTERVYVRHGFKFEFFRMSDTGTGQYEFNGYHPGDDGPLEIVGRVPRQELEAFEFLGRTWMKPQDHDLSLTLSYGNWRVPDPTWNSLAGPCIVERHPWRPGPVPSPRRR